MKMTNSLYLFILILTISGTLSFLTNLYDFVNISTFIIGTGLYAGLFEILLFGFYGESLRTGKSSIMLGFTFCAIITIFINWDYDYRVLLFNLNRTDSILFELPAVVSFFLSILLYFRVRSKIRSQAR